MTADDRDHKEDPLIVPDEDVPTRLRDERDESRMTGDSQPRVIVRHYEWTSSDAGRSGGIAGFVKAVIGTFVFLAVAAVALVGVWLLIAVGIVFALIAGLGSLFFSPGRRG